jgi:hypothetical protein
MGFQRPPVAFENESLGCMEGCEVRGASSVLEQICFQHPPATGEHVPGGFEKLGALWPQRAIPSRLIASMIGRSLT